MSPPPTASSRRVPPPCWTPDETFSLVKAYAHRWLSLNRGYLRTSDWDAVSSAVSSAYPGSPKSSIQCRHKIEKLRKRYRSEKKRTLALPGRFVSSWDLFPLLDSINFGSSSAVGCSSQVHDTFDQKVGIKIVDDKNLTRNYTKADGDLDQDFGLDSDFRDELHYDNMYFDGDFGGIKMINDGNWAASESRAKDYVKIDGDFKSNRGYDRALGAGFGVKMPFDRNYVSQGVGLKSNKSSRILDFDCNIDGFPVKTLGNRILAPPPPGFKLKSYSKIDGKFYPNPYDDHGADKGVSNGSGSSFFAKTSDRGSAPSEIKLRNNVTVGGNNDGNLDFEVMNGYGSSSRSSSGKKNDRGGAKRGSDPLDELVSSIALLTERFVKIEEMKMEMAMETQKIRMEMEMKHSQMILESQQHILDAFLTWSFEQKKKKVKVELVSANRTGNGDEV